MKILVLGSAAGGGFPQWNCNCANCAGVRNGTINAKIAVTARIIREPNISILLYTLAKRIMSKFFIISFYVCSHIKRLSYMNTLLNRYVRRALVDELRTLPTPPGAKLPGL